LPAPFNDSDARVMAALVGQLMRPTPELERWIDRMRDESGLSNFTRGCAHNRHKINLTFCSLNF